jgi:hypothetical protein
MTPDEYLVQIAAKYRADAGANSLPYKLAHEMSPLIRQCFSDNLNEIYFAGSYEKRTGIKGDSDLDLFVSLKYTTEASLKNMYFKLYSHLSSKGLQPIQQNVSVGLNYKQIHIDITPGIQQGPNRNDHSIYRSRIDSWVKTNIFDHIEHIKKSNRTNEIIILKVWKKLHNLQFPSFYLELAVLDALHNRPTNNTASNLVVIFRYLSEDFVTTRIIDPVNSNNIVSDDLNYNEKMLISRSAADSLSQSNWANVVW